MTRVKRFLAGLLAFRANLQGLDGRADGVLDSGIHPGHLGIHVVLLHCSNLVLRLCNKLLVVSGVESLGYVILSPPIVVHSIGQIPYTC